MSTAADAPEAIQIEDLRHPILTPAQEEALAEAERNPVELSSAAILAAAEERAGLSDFGPDDFRERLDLLVDVASWEGHSELTKAGFFYRAVRAATTRLLAHDLVERNPEIEERPIERPIIIAGLPRSGTTHLLNLTCADSRLRSLPYWRAVEPIPLPGEMAGNGQSDPRYQRAAWSWERIQQLNPFQAPHHPMDPEHVSEDGELQLPDFSTYVWEWSMNAGRWRDYYLAHDQVPHYRYGRRMLQICDHLDDSQKRWVVKSPQHFEQVRVLREVYPDATVAFIHRDPVAVLRSIVSHVAYTSRTRLRDHEEIDLGQVLGYWTDRVERLLRAYERDADLIPAEQRVDVYFKRFMGDDVGTVERLLETAGLARTERQSAELQAQMANHQRDKYGRLAYDLEGDFGVDPAALRERFGFYLDRFPDATA